PITLKECAGQAAETAGQAAESVDEPNTQAAGLDPTALRLDRLPERPEPGESETHRTAGGRASERGGAQGGPVSRSLTGQQREDPQRGRGAEPETKEARPATPAKNEAEPTAPGVDAAPEGPGITPPPQDGRNRLPRTILSAAVLVAVAIVTALAATRT